MKLSSISFFVVLLALSDFEKEKVLEINEIVRCRILEDKIMSYDETNPFSQIYICFNPYNVEIGCNDLFNSTSTKKYFVIKHKLSYLDDVEKIVDLTCNYLVGIKAANLKIFCKLSDSCSVAYTSNTSHEPMAICLETKYIYRKIMKRLYDLGKRNVRIFYNHFYQFTELYTPGILYNEFYDNEWMFIYSFKEYENIIKIELNSKDLKINDFLQHYITFYYGNNATAKTYEFTRKNLFNVGMFSFNVTFLNYLNDTYAPEIFSGVFKLDNDGKDYFIHFLLFINLLTSSTYFNQMIERCFINFYSKGETMFIEILESLCIHQKNSKEIFNQMKLSFGHPLMKNLSNNLSNEISITIRKANSIDKIQKNLKLLSYLFEYIKKDDSIDLKEVFEILHNVFVVQDISKKHIKVIEDINTLLSKTFESKNNVVLIGLRTSGQKEFRIPDNDTEMVIKDFRTLYLENFKG